MPVSIYRRNERSGVVIVCDHCKKTIDDAKDGNFLWKWSVDTTEVPEGATTSDIAFTHKACDAAFERATARVPGDSWLSSELSHTMARLLNNLGMGGTELAQAQDGVRKLSQLG